VPEKQEPSMNRNPLTFSAWLWARATLAVAGEAEPPGAGATAADACLEQFNAGRPWIECPATFEPDAEAREALSQMTLGMVRSASCRTDLRLERKGLVGTYLVGGTLQLEPHDVFCDLQTETFLLPSVKITVAPKVTFLNRTVTDVSLGVVSIADVPPFVVAPINDAAESKFIRGQLAKALNSFLSQALSE
jgi:hypothetical protein